jgi:phosphoglycolate phosphatase
MRTVVFDLDGTLADTSADLLAAANACFRELGHGDLLGPGDALTAFHGGRAMLTLGFARLGLGDGGVAAAYPRLLEAYEAGIDRETRLYPGAEAAVAELRGAGFRTAICTNKPERLARILLDRLGVAGLFDALVGADTLPVRKPDPAPFRLAVTQAGGDPARAILIGDTDTDRRTARAAGVPCVLVSFGPEGHGIARLSPEAMLHGYGDLPALAAQLLAEDAA